jgi:hypothetical protein
VCFIKAELSWVWWFTLVIPAFKRLRQKDTKFLASMDYINKFKARIHSKTLSQKNENKGD